MSVIVALGSGCSCDLKPARVDFADKAVDNGEVTAMVLSQSGSAPAVEDDLPSPSIALQHRALAATVRVVLREGDGSGVILHRDSDDFLYVLTVWHAAKQDIEWVHVFDPMESLDKPVARLPAPSLVSHHERLDLAVIRVKVPTQLKTVNLELPQGDLDNPPRFAYSTGCHSGPPTLLTERVRGSTTYRLVITGKTRLMWSTHVPQEEGRSGGALISVDGELIGLALGKRYGKNQSSGFYCHFREIRDYLIDSGPRSLVRCDASDKYDN